MNDLLEFRLFQELDSFLLLLFFLMDAGRGELKLFPRTTENVFLSLYYFRLVGLIFILFSGIYFILCAIHLWKSWYTLLLNALANHWEEMRCENFVGRHCLSIIVGNALKIYWTCTKCFPNFADKNAESSWLCDHEMQIRLDLFPDDNKHS